MYQKGWQRARGEKVSDRPNQDLYRPQRSGAGL